MLNKTENLVIVSGRLTGQFKVSGRVRQEDPLSSLLFSVLLEDAIRDAGIKRTGLI